MLDFQGGAFVAADVFVLLTLARAGAAGTRPR